MVRTRAAATAAPAASLAAAPRRPIKVTPLEKEKAKKPAKQVEEEPKPTTRATRAKKALAELDEEPKATKTTATKARGRPKKTEIAVEPAEPEQELSAEKLTEKPKRATRSTRATATTASSAAKGKPAARTTRTTKAAPKERPTETAEPEEKPVAEETAVPAKATTKKKVTFQDIIEDDKENQPISTRGRKKGNSDAARAATKESGLRAKPVRNAAAATRSSKRTKDQASDDEDEKPKKKIQRVLTPKKITQIAKATTPEEASDDELNGGKTPVRDLSLSPRRPQTNLTAEAIVRTLSPAKKLDFTQSLLQQSAKKNTEEASGSLMSPARRPPASPAKIFSQSTSRSLPKGSNNETTNGLTSPARRLIDSPAKLLFPNATKHDHRVNLSQTASNLFQSPKRLAAFDPARMFAHSAVKPQKNDFSKSSFLSSPAKRTGAFSPLKRSTPIQSVAKDVQHHGESSDELDVNDMEVTELMNDMAEEITVSSHQRASVSPIRTYKLSVDELQMEFDDSILPVRSPLKVVKSPVKLGPQAEEVPILGQDADATELDLEMEDTMPSVQSTPRTTSVHDSTFINPQALEAERDQAPEHLPQDMTMSDEGDDTIVLPENAAAATPRSVVFAYQDNDSSIDELAPSPQEDVVATFLQMPGTPATVHEHELTNMLSSPATSGQMSTASVSEELEAEAMLPADLHENELSMMCGTPKAAVTSETASHAEQDSPASLYEHELTVMADAFTPRPASAKMKTPKAAATPASIAEHELTMIGGTPKSLITPRATSVPEEDSPASLAENELTMMADAFTPAPIVESSIAIDMEDSSIGLAENELTLIAGAFTPGPANAQSPLSSPIEAQTPVPSIAQRNCASNTPASIAEHELTVMGQTSPGKEAFEVSEHTPIPAAMEPATFTPDMPIPRKFHMHTVISKVPLKPEAEDSPAKLHIKKRKRPHSLGAQPDFVDISDQVTPAKAARTASSPDAPSARASTVATPAASTDHRTPASKYLSTKNARRAVSAPLPRTPLTEFANSSSNILSGATIYVDVRTSEGADASAIYIDLLTSLGAKVLKEWKDTLTHIVYKDGSSKILERARLSDVDVKVVGVSWPLDCEAQKTWVEEDGYLLNLTSTDHILQSVTKSARRKSMEPSMLIADGSGSVKRSKSKSVRRSSIRPLAVADNTPRSSLDNEEAMTMTTPTANPAKKAADLEKNSLTAAWKSINATHNLGEDTPARRTLELLQKSYEIENGWDDSLLSSINDDEDQENTPRGSHDHETEDGETELIETGLTPAPYKLREQIEPGSAPAKATNNGMMSYRERVEEMERREMRDNAFGTNKGSRGKNGKRMTMFGFGKVGSEPVRQSPLGR